MSSRVQRMRARLGSASHRRVRVILQRLVLLWFVALLITGATAAWGLASVREHVETTRTTITPLVDAAHEMQGALLQAQTASRGYVISQDENFAQDYVRATADLTDAQERLETVAAGRLSQIQRMNEAVDEWLVLTRRPDSSSPRSTTDLQQTAAAMDEALAELGSISNTAVELRTQSRAELNRSMRVANIALLAAALVSSAVILVALRRVDQLLAAPLRNLQRTVARQRHGEVDAVADTSRGAVELIHLAETFNEAVREAREVVTQRERTVEQLHELNRQKSMFVSTTNHELRTPLTSISGYVEMLQDGDFGTITPEQDRVLNVVQRNTNRLQVLIEDLLLINKLDQEQDGRSRHYRELDLADCASRVMTNLVPQAARGHVTLTEELAGTWPALGDRDRLERAITNVVGNAVKFTPPGGTVTLSLSRTPDGNGARLTCEDTGMGIPAQDIDLLFTSFTRASNAADQQIPGTGLGLVIVRTIVEQHGGTVGLRSIEGEGTTVIMDLPLVSEDGAAPPREG
ncbi:sensor histidine kinase [Kocuria sp. cx-116]|uniref:sensor histidine kinase n=1 Tax=Kocuria sp. cx-116 TaxID=2771378 RepID=UPI002A4E2294|nr:ATP-binding protein [Kocuria sp. cx-116]